MPEGSHPECTCPEYTQGLRICSGVCAVLFRLQRGDDYKKETMLHPMWLLRNHPLYELVQSDLPLSIISAPVVQARENLAASSVAPTGVLRHACLSNLFEEVLPQSLKSPFFEQLRDILLRHKQVLAGQAPSSHPPLFAPSSQISVLQQNAMQGSQQDAVNHSRLCNGNQSGYNRGSHGRVAKAQAKDPTAFDLAKRALLGAQVTCPCGVSFTNQKSTRAYHRSNNKIHLAWVAGGCLTTNQPASLAQSAGLQAAVEESASSPMSPSASRMCCIICKFCLHSTLKSSIISHTPS